MRRALLACLLFAGCAALRSAEPPLLVISLDGFRWDYLEKYPAESATLRSLRRQGVTTRSLVPVFPSNTFPNHYSIVTGLYPSRHGIVNNDFLDASTGQFFRYNQPAVALDPRWWGGEPIWVTAINQGRKAAASFWVGSEVAIGGIRPTHWRPYNYSVPFETRLAEIHGWLKAPAAERPALIVLYFEETNSAGHTWGPDSPQVAAAVKLLDQRVATLLEAVRGEQIEPNVMIVSDHGMTGMSADRVVLLDDHLDLARITVDADGSVVALRPHDGDVAALVQALQRLPHARVYRVEDLPAHFHFGRTARTAPVWVLPEEGWHVGLRSGFERLRRRYAANLGYVAGDHGYDPALPSMHGIFIGHGPAFRRGVELPPAENVHLYNLMCAVLGLRAAPNDGDDRLVRAALAPR